MSALYAAITTLAAPGALIPCPVCEGAGEDRCDACDSKGVIESAMAQSVRLIWRCPRVRQSRNADERELALADYLHSELLYDHPDPDGVHPAAGEYGRNCARCRAVAADMLAHGGWSVQDMALLGEAIERGWDEVARG